MSARVAAAVLACLAAGCAITGTRARDDLRFSGNRTFTVERLRGVIGVEVELVRREYRPSAIDDAAFAVEEFYAGQGFPFCTVDYELLDPPADGVYAELAIDEGPRTELERVELEGNTTFATVELLAFLNAPRDEGRTWYVERAVDNAASAISAYYYAQGFLDVDVAAPVTTFAADRQSASARIAITEGQRYRLAAVQLEGDAIEAPDWSGLVGEPYTPRLGLAVRGRVLETLGQRGYPEPEVDLVEERGSGSEGGAVTLRAQVSTGPRVTISAVRVVGNEKTRKSRILSALKLEPGSVYDSERERESFTELYRSGLFSSVDLELEGEGGERTLVVSVEELPSLEVYVEPGYGSYERFRLGAGLRESNLFGTGRVLDLSGSVSEFLQRGQIDLIDRLFLGSDVQANLTLLAQRRVEPAFTDRELGTGVTFTKRYTERLEASLSYAYRSTEVLEIEVLGPDVQEILEDVDVSSIALSPTYDTRDQVFSPTRGSISRVGVELASEALGSEIDFLRTSVRHASFLPLLPGTVLGLSFEGGVIAPLADTETIPIQFRYFNGGESSVRSFKQDQLGPADAEGTPVGGEAYTVLSAELRQDLFGRLQGALFFDTGNVQLEWQDALSFEDLESAIGAGLRYMLPVGAVRLDFGVNPDPGPDDEDYVLHFSVGMAF